MMNNANLINQDSGNVEWYTPSTIIEAARGVLGVIDLDPASSEEANRVVKASRFFSIRDNGLEQEWHGKVWMNHPFSRGGNAKWVNKLIKEYGAGNVEEAICICFASTSEKWFAPLTSFPQCYLTPRVKYSSSSNKVSPPKGSVVTYFGDNLPLFHQVFRSLGNVMVPYKGVDSP